MKDVVQFAAPRIAILESDNANATGPNDGGETSIQVGQAKPLPMRGHTAARIEAAWVVGNHRLALISSTTRDCPRQETLLIALGDSGQLRPLGKCQEHFATTLTGEVWTARLIASRQSNPRASPNWIFQNGNLIAGGVQPNLGTRRRPQASERPTEAERGADPDRVMEPDRGAEQERSVAPEPPRTEPPSLVAPPSISRPVGDDVVPPPVGAGPLPGRPKPSPRLF